MTEEKARQLLCLLLTENGARVPQGADTDALIRLYLAPGSLPGAMEDALAEIFGAAAETPDEPPPRPASQ